MGMLTLLVAACFSKEAPGPAAAEPSAEAIEPASVERAVLIDEEGGEHPTWKVKAGVDLARDLVGELAVQSCLEHPDASDVILRGVQFQTSSRILIAGPACRSAGQQGEGDNDDCYDNRNRPSHIVSFTMCEILSRQS